MPHPTTRIVIMAKAPVPGRAKTRLAPVLGREGASALALRMLTHTVATALSVQPADVELCTCPQAAHPDWAQARQALGTPARPLIWSHQGEGDLGQRMARIVQRSLAHRQAVILVGTDCPALSPALLAGAIDSLRTHDATLAPTADGGYCLLGLREHIPAIFNHMPWSTAQVLPLTLERLRHAACAVHLLPLQHDVDTPEDLMHVPTGWLPAPHHAGVGP
jgi:uncharacterized protein